MSSPCESEWGSDCWKCKEDENRQQSCKTESPAALTEHHPQLAANFISLQELSGEPEASL